ncbi:hypothetical protein F5Y08DRAFT_315838 [Xylaria arbuscula]|nr:hypothetical protein F5Y08DRAFT_315838 [Xylaria arbuscula]
MFNDVSQQDCDPRRTCRVQRYSLRESSQSVGTASQASCSCDDAASLHRSISTGWQTHARYHPLLHCLHRGPWRPSDLIPTPPTYTVDRSFILSIPSISCTLCAS